MNSTHIVLIGAGYGGVAAAKELARHYRKSPEVKITLVDKNPFHTLMTELHEVAGGRCEPKSVRVSLETIFGGTQVRTLVDLVKDVDFAKREVHCEVETLPYDYLILGPGAEPEFFGVPGAREHAYTLWSYDDAMRLRFRIEDQFRKASREADETIRRRHLTFAVAGAGFTGIEMLGELLEWRPVLCREFEIDPSEVRIMMVEAMADILPNLPKPLRQKAASFIEKKGGEMHLGTPIAEVTPEGFKTKDGKDVNCATLIWTCGVRGSAFAGGLAIHQAEDPCAERADGTCTEEEQNQRFNIKKKSRLLTNAFLQSLDSERVFVVGDVLWHSERNRVLPQIVETAIQTGATVAHNVIASIENTPKKEHKSAYHGFMVSVGSRFAVADLMGVKLVGFFAMAMKHLVNLHYLWEVAGVNSCWGYLKEHFLDIKHNRSQLGGHLGWKVPGYWTVLLRVYLGFLWAVQGLDKVLKGWIDPSKGTKTGWMFSPGVVQAGVETAAAGSGADAAAAAESWDAGTAASDAGWDSAADTAAAVSAPAAETWDAGTAATEAGWESADAAVSAAGEAAAAAGAGAADAWTSFWTGLNLEKWLESPILPKDFFLVQWNQWFMDNLVSLLPFYLLQIGIALGEVAIGLALMAGLFTWPAAVASIALVAVFTLSGMFAWNQLFYLFGALVLMGGAGRVFGLDYWVMPILQRWWNGLGFVRRWHLFVDEPTIDFRRK